MADLWDLATLEALAPTPKAWAEAKKLSASGAFTDIGPATHSRHAWHATTRGSSGTYSTLVVAQLGRLAFRCECPSHQYPCKHALGLAYHLATHPELRPALEPPATAPELDALVRACFANPKNNLPRLVLADYLEERDEIDRATILRIQCELPPPKKKGEKPKIPRGMVKPLKEAIGRVLADLSVNRQQPEFFRLSLANFEFIRGFLSVQIHPFHLLMASKATERLWELFRQGWVENVVVSGFGGNESVEMLAALRGAGNIDFSQGWFVPSALVTVAAELRPGQSDSRVQRVTVPKRHAAAFARLIGEPTKRQLAVERVQSHLQLTPTKFRMLVDSGILHGVRTLTLGGELGDQGLRQLASSRAMNDLQDLRFHAVDVPPADWKDLWAAEAGDLRALEVEIVPLGDESIRAFCRGKLTPRDRLTFLAANLTDAGVAELAACPRLATLRHLNLTGNRIGDESLDALLRSPHLARVEQFHLAQTDITAGRLPAALFAAPRRQALCLATERGTFRLLRRDPEGTTFQVGSEEYERSTLTWPADAEPCPEPLAALELDSVSLSRTTLRRLREWLTGQTVASIQFRGCQLRNDDIPDLLKLVEQVKPTELNLGNNEIGVQGCKALAESPALATVRVLDLSFNPIRLNGAMAIAESANRGKLRSFRAVGVGRTLSAAQRKNLTAAFKGVRLYL